MTITTKNLIVSALLIGWAIMLPPGCNGKQKSESFKHSPPDTIMTFMVYNFKGIKWDVGYKIRKDSLMFSSVDSVTQKKKWARTGEYFIPFADTVRNKLGIAIADSTGKYQIKVVSYLPIDPSLIIKDLNFGLDSLLKKNIPK